MTSSTGDKALDERMDQLFLVLDMAGFPYDELTYKALAQLAHEMQTYNGLEKFTPVDTVPDEQSQKALAKVRAEWGEKQQ